MKNGIYLVFLAVFLSACVSGDAGHEFYLHGRGLNLPEGRTLDHCHGYGCRNISEITLSKKEWQQVEALFKPAAKTAKVERKKIAKAVGLLERLVAPKDGTQDDVRGTFRKTGPGQLDCVDESTNTTTYLALLQSHGLLKFHTLRSPTMRLPPFAGRWPHQTAVITEIKTGESYAIDSWFHDNGADAEIIDLKTWKSGWKPESVRDFL
jgi:hypothetical protein